MSLRDPRCMRCKGVTKFHKRCLKKVHAVTEFCSLHQNQPCCPICLEPTIENPIECGHSMHLKCMKGLTKLECPLCRSPLKHIPKSLRISIEKNVVELKKEREEEERNALIRLERNESTDLLNVIMFAAIMMNADTISSMGTCECDRCQDMRQMFLQEQIMHMLGE